MWFDTYSNPVENISSSARRHGLLVVKDTDNAYIDVTNNCSRCGGAGGWQFWPGFTCYLCGGSGLARQKRVKLYSAEKLAKLTATKEKRAETKRNKQLASQEAFKATEIDLFKVLERHINVPFIQSVRDTITKTGKVTDKQRDAIMTAAKRIEDREQTEAVKTNEHIGTVGERSEFVGTIVRRFSFDNDFGGGYITLIEDADGRCIKHAGNGALPRIMKGTKIRFMAMVKKHDDYQGRKQTIITRPTQIEEIVR